MTSDTEFISDYRALADAPGLKRIVIDVTALNRLLNLASVAIRYREFARLRQKKVDRRKAKPRRP